MQFSNNNWFDFNTAADQGNYTHEAITERKEKLRDMLFNDLSGHLIRLLPAGNIDRNKFQVGDIQGNSGKSLVVELEGSKRGMWHDFATGEGGDILALWAAVFGINPTDQFTELLDAIESWLYCSFALEAQPDNDNKVNKKNIYIDKLGAYTGKWDYKDRDGKLIACVYRYDFPNGKKQYRPWDVKTRSSHAPNPRPLYNQPGIANAEQVILVEGEKCVEALISQEFCATTAMNGANAPVEKTDWSPLKDKKVIIWPDNDAVGLEYAKKAAQTISQIGARKVILLTPPVDKPEKWDAADAIEEGFYIPDFLETGEQVKSGAETLVVPGYNIAQLWHDNEPGMEDIIAPKLLTPGSLLVFGGASKVGKSDFMLSWLAHMAAGKSFLGLIPSHQVKIFYCQAEVRYQYLRDRVKSLPFTTEEIDLIGANFVMTSNLRMLLNEKGVQEVIKTIRHFFPDSGPDIIAVDPISNMFDGGPNSKGENDNGSMLFFLLERIERLREACNLNCGIILVHHTRKISKKQFADEIFQALRGASSLRTYYTSGMLLFRPDETKTERQLHFELREGAAIPMKLVDKIGKNWVELNPHAERLVNKKQGNKLDAERNRKKDVILQLLSDKAREGYLYTYNQFSEKFENQAGLGSKDTIYDRLSVLSTKGYIKFCKDVVDFGYAKSRSKYGFLCVEGMVFGKKEMPVLPSHYKCPNTGAVLPVENPQVWVIPLCEE